MKESLRCPQCASENVRFSRKHGRYDCEDCGHEFVPAKLFTPKRVFISYGHDEHTSLALRLRDDLKARGHDVWFDEERLKPGHDWEVFIEKGLEYLTADKANAVVLLLLTPHAVRRPDGYCLNEVARALARGLSVIPLMVVESEPPLSICRIQWLDMRECIPIQEKETFYQPRFERLLKAIEEDQLDFEGTQQRLIKVLQPLEFDADILHHLPKFTGRKWIFDKVDAWLAENPPRQRVFWISGGPGVGKTALSAVLSYRYLEVAALHLCKFGHVQKSDARRVVTSVAYQLTTQLPEYEARLAAMDVERLMLDDARTLFDSLLVQPLVKLTPPGRAIVILIDALDEATHDGHNELASFIAAEFPRTPAWLRLVITSRPDAAVTSPLQGLDPFILDTETEANRADIFAYLWRELVPQIANRPDANHLVQQILDKSEGVFLYAERVCHDLWHGYLSLDHLEQFPQGLAGAFWQFLERQFPDLDRFRKDVRPALRVILAAQEPLPTETLQRLFDWQDEELRDFMRNLSSLFPVAQESGREVIRPYHKSLADWLADEAKAGAYFVSAVEGHRMLAQFGWGEYQRGLSTLMPYLLRHLAAHLVCAERWDDVCALLCDLRYLEARCAAGQVFDLQTDYHLALDALPELQPERAARQAREDRLRRWTAEIIEYARQWNEGRGRPALPEVIPSVEPWSEERIQADSRRIIENPTRADQLFTFARFGETECYRLVEFGQREGFLVQQAFNSAPAGPVHAAADRLYRNITTPLLLCHWPPDAAYHPHPVLLRTLEGHSGDVTSVCVMPDGRHAVSGSWDYTVKVWDLETGRCLRTLEGHRERVLTVSATPDGRRAVSGSHDKTVRVWDLESGQCLRTLEGHSSGISSVSMTPDGRRAVSGSYDHTLRVWDLETGRCLRALEGYGGEITSESLKPDTRRLMVSVTPDGRRAVSGGDDPVLRVWDLETGQCLRTLEGHTDGVRCLSVTADGRQVVSGSSDETLRVWDVETGQCLRALAGHRDGVRVVGLTLDGRRAVSASYADQPTLRVWNLETGQCLGMLEGHCGTVDSVSVTPEGRRAVSGNPDGTIRIWDLESGMYPPKLQSHSDNVTAIAVTPNGLHAVSGSWDKTLRVWDLASGQYLRTLAGHRDSVWCVSVTPDGRRAVSGSRGYDHNLLLWDLDSGECLRILDGHGRGVSSVSVTPDGRRAVSVGEEDRILQVWDLASGACLRTLEGNGFQVNSACVTADGRHVVSGSWCDGRNLQVWDLESGECLRMLGGHLLGISSVAVTPDGRHAVSRGREDKALRVWDLESGLCLRTLEGHGSYVCDVSVTPDGRRAVSGSLDHTLRFWDLENGRCLRTLEGHSSCVYHVSVTPDGRWAVSGGLDDTLRVWDLEKGTCLAVFPADGSVTAIADVFGPIVIGTDPGSVIFLDVHGMAPTSDPKAETLADSSDEGYEQLLRRGLDISRREKGNDHAETLAHLAALTVHLEKMGKATEARAFAEERDCLAKHHRDAT